MKLSLVTYILIILFNMLEFSCGGGSSCINTTKDSTVITDDQYMSPAKDSASAPIDTSDRSHKIDYHDTITGHQEPTIDTAKIRSAVFGYSFFKNIQEHETRNINAYVSVINAISSVIDTLKGINATDIPERKNDTATIITKNILLFKSLDVQLLNAGDSDFIIRPFADDRQLIDNINGNSWTWSVTPRTGKLHGSLVMNVIAEKSDGSREPFSTITIPITIIIDKELSRTLWEWVMNNPEKVITIILIPFLVFFWKQVTGLFKKKIST